MADPKAASNQGSSKRKKSTSLEREIARFNGELTRRDEEPPFKKQKLEYEGSKSEPQNRLSLTQNSDQTYHFGNTPSKSLDNITLTSPDSAYNSSIERSPLVRLPSSIDTTSSGLGTEISDWSGPIVDGNHQQHDGEPESDNLSKFLHSNFTKLKEEMDPSEIADHLYNDSVIPHASREAISEERGRSKQVEVLIKAVARSPDLRKPSTELKFIKAFKEQNCLHLLDGLGKDSISHSLGKGFNKTEILTKLHLCGKDLEETVEPRHIIDDLVSLGMLTLLEHDDITTTILKEDRVRCLVHYLKKDPETYFPIFCQAVEKEYPELGKKLQKESGADHFDMKEEKVELYVKVNLRETTELTISKGDDGGNTYVKFTMEGEEDLEQMIVDEYSRTPSPRLGEEAMEIGFAVDSVNFACIKINLNQLSQQAQLRLFNKFKESPQFLGTWLRSILSQEKLKEMQRRGISNVKFKVHVKKPSSVHCSCKLKKENIVTHFSCIESSIKNVDNIVQAFARFPDFTEETRKAFADLMQTDVVGRPEAFLLKVLDVTDTAVCLLQRELVKTGQTSLLDLITKTKIPLDSKLRNVTVKSLKKCFSFLQDEIEPRKFIDTLGRIPGNDEVSEFVMSQEPRRTRCQRFLEFIQREGQLAVDQFVQALMAENKKYVLEALTSVDNKDQRNENDVERLRDAILEKFNEIVTEVDTRPLRCVFIERKVMKAKKYDMVCKHPDRKSRIVNLLKEILQQNGQVLSCFLHALETRGYEKLAAEITKKKDAYTPCPRLDMPGVVVFQGSCELKYSLESERESPLQLELHQQIYGCERIDKDMYTKRWLEQISQDPISRKRPYSSFGQDEEDPIKPKQFFSDPDKDSGICSIDFKRGDEALDKHSQIQDDRSSQLSLSIPTSPSTSPSLSYEFISPPVSPVSVSSTITSFRPGKYYAPGLSTKEMNMGCLMPNLPDSCLSREKNVHCHVNLVNGESRRKEDGSRNVTMLQGEQSLTEDWLDLFDEDRLRIEDTSPNRLGFGTSPGDFGLRSLSRRRDELHLFAEESKGKVGGSQNATRPQRKFYIQPRKRGNLTTEGFYLQSPSLTADEFFLLPEETQRNENGSQNARRTQSKFYSQWRKRRNVFGLPTKGFGLQSPSLTEEGLCLLAEESQRNDDGSQNATRTQSKFYTPPRKSRCLFGLPTNGLSSQSSITEGKHHLFAGEIQMEQDDPLDGIRIHSKDLESLNRQGLHSLPRKSRCLFGLPTNGLSSQSSPITEGKHHLFAGENQMEQDDPLDWIRIHSKDLESLNRQVLHSLPSVPSGKRRNHFGSIT